MYQSLYFSLLYSIPLASLPQFIYPCTVDGHEVCFQFRVIMNHAGMSVLLTVFCCTNICISVGYILRSGLLGVTPRECVF